MGWNAPRRMTGRRQTYKLKTEKGKRKKKRNDADGQKKGEIITLNTQMQPLRSIRPGDGADARNGA